MVTSIVIERLQVVFFISWIEDIKITWLEFPVQFSAISQSFTASRHKTPLGSNWKKRTENYCLDFSISCLKCNAFLRVLTKIKNVKFSCADWSGKTFLSLVQTLHLSSHRPFTGASGTTEAPTLSTTECIECGAEQGKCSPGTQDPWHLSNQYCSGLQHYLDQVTVPFCDYFTLLYKTGRVILIFFLGMNNTAKL